MQRFRHDRIKTFGVGKDLSSREWRSVFRQLMAAGYLTADPAGQGGFQLTDKSWSLLKGEQTIQFRRDVETAKALRIGRDTRHAPPASLDDRSLGLWEHLRRLRFEIAKEMELPAYVIFHDKTLKEMAVHRPRTHEDLLQITGVGEIKAAQFGERFLDAIQTWENGDPPR
jgi:ATP-dependent DNA helicase RecQ